MKSKSFSLYNLKISWRKALRILYRYSGRGKNQNIDYILISHRGNINGPNTNLENSPDYLKTALKNGYHVEVDVWFVDGNFFLGHDKPNYLINENFLEDERIWCHGKNLASMQVMLKNSRIHCFWHQDDQITLTSRNYVWTYPGAELINNSILVLPEKLNPTTISKNYVGICSDFVENYK
jgi:hypothetical protein